ANKRRVKLIRKRRMPKQTRAMPKVRCRIETFGSICLATESLSFVLRSLCDCLLFVCCRTCRCRRCSARHQSRFSAIHFFMHTRCFLAASFGQATERACNRCFGNWKAQRQRLVSLSEICTQLFCVISQFAAMDFHAF